MNKIFVTKNEDIASVVEKVLETRDDSIVLVIPKSSRLLGSLANFHLLKREAESVGRTILIESVDEQILALAKASGLPAANPFLSGPRRPVSDIVSRGTASLITRPFRFEESASRPQFASRLRSKMHLHKEEEEQHVPASDAEEQGWKAGAGAHAFSARQRRGEAEEPFANLSEPPSEPASASASDSVSSGAPRARSLGSRLHSRLRFGRRKILIMGGAGAFLILVIVAAMVWLPRAEIVITRKKQPWSLEETIVADKRVAAVVPVSLQIPAQLFEEKRNVRLSFPASGRKQVERKATGSVTIYNAYSSEKQSLVQNTRLLTPEGKIFRLVLGITVPGARVEEGKIIPFSIEVKVIADKPGAEYNVGPVSRFTIPGFQGSPKFQGFYAESKAPMTGGYIGEVALPTAEDLTKGREEIARTLRDVLNGFLRSQLPKDWSAPEGGTQFRIIKETVFDAGDSARVSAQAAGEFSIFAEAEMKLFAFRAEDARTLAVAGARKELGEEMEPVELAVSFGKVTANFDSGRLQIPASYKGVFAEHIDRGVFRERAAGKSESDLRTLIATLPGFESARISLWPFWVTRVPANVERIEVRIE
ncbi:MAG: hypothetical protein Q8Q41_04915 [bacterium]|nr:hypothetical protein [bacterium]